MKKLSRKKRFTIRVREPFNFILTVRKPAGWYWITPYEVVEQNRYWSTLRLRDEILVGVKLTQKGSEVRVEVYSEDYVTGEQVNEVSSVLGIGLGAEINLKEFYKVAGRDCFLEHVFKDLYGMKPYFSNSVFERALLAICLQMAPIKRSYEMLRSIIEVYGETLTFEGKTIRHWPSPSRLKAVPEEELKKRCKLGYRAKFIHGLAVLRPLPDIVELWEKPTEKALKELTRLPGIGEYSAGIILTRNTSPIDVWSSGIFHKLFFGESPEKPRKAIKRVVEEAERRYGEWKWEAFAYTLNALPKLESLIRRREGE